MQVEFVTVDVFTDRQFGGNPVWDAWVSPGNTPARATVEAKLASPDYKVEIMVVAAR